MAYTESTIRNSISCHYPSMTCPRVHYVRTKKFFIPYDLWVSGLPPYITVLHERLTSRYLCI